MIEAFFKFIGMAVIFVGIAYSILIFLSKKWIENKFATKLEEFKSIQNRELEDFRHKINALANRVVKIHEKEYEVLPEAWAKLHDANNCIASIVNPLQQYPDFNRLNEAEIKSILEECKWADHVIKSFIDSHDKNEEFRKRRFWQHLADAKFKFSDFHSYILKNRIFLSEELKEEFNKADNLLWDVLVTREMGEEANDYKMRHESYKMLKKDIESILNAIEKRVQERLRYNEAF